MGDEDTTQEPKEEEEARKEGGEGQRKNPFVWVAILYIWAIFIYILYNIAIL